MAKDKFVPIDMSIFEENGQPQPSVPDPQAPAAPVAAPAPQIDALQATPADQRTPEQQKQLADAVALEQEKAQILLAGEAQKKLDAAAAKVKPGQDADRPGAPSILTPEEQAALAAHVNANAQDAALQANAANESAVPTALKLPLMAAKGVLSAVDGANQTLTGSKAFASGAADIPDVGAATGRVTKSIAQFTTGMVVSGGALGAAGVGAGLVRAGVASGLSGSLFQDPHEENLSNLIQENPTLANPITDFLAAKPEDGEALARFKKFVENAGLGATAEGLITGLRGLRAARAVKAGDAAATGTYHESMDELQKLIHQAQSPEGVKGIKLGQDAIQAQVSAADAAANGGATSAVEAGATPAATAAAQSPKALVPEAPRSLISPADADKLRASVDNTITQANGGTHFNFAHLPDNYDAKSMINEVSKIVEPAIQETTGGVQTLKETEDLAGILGQNKAQLLSTLAVDAKGAKEAAARVIAGKSILVDLSQQIADQSRLINAMQAAGKDSAEEEAKLLKLMNVHGDLQVNLKGAITGAARTTSAGRIDVKEAAQLFAMADGDPAAISRIVRPLTTGEKVVGAITEFRTNAMLSHLTTLVVKGTADAVNAVGLPFAKIVGGALHGDLGAIKDGIGTYVGLTKSVGDSLSMARKALNLGHQVLATKAGINEVPRAFIASTNKGPFGTFVNALGSVVRLPSRLIGTLDEFSKQLNYRAAVYSQASREGAAAGLTGDALAAHIETTAARAFDGAGVATNESALRYAKEATFTSDLDYGLGKWLQDGANKHPLIRTIVPFIKVPTNLIRQAWALTPGLQHLQRQFAEDLAAGGSRAAMARGKQVIGGMLYAHAVNLATSGRITGSGPTDPEARKALLATGWQPYSVKHDDGTYTSYARLDPWGIPFGLAADFAETAGQMNQQTASDTAVALTAALAHNLTSKTYLGGMIDMLDAVAQPKEKGLKVLQAFAGSFVPNTKQFTDMLPQTADPFMREARTVLDGVRKKIPGWSNTLPPVRNIYGDAVHVPAGFGPDTLSPFHESTGMNDKLLTELAKFPKGFAMPGKIAGQQVDLTQIPSKEGGFDAYDRLLQLNGSVKIGGKNLKDRLTAFIESPAYEKLTDEGPGYSGSKYEAIGQLLGQHRTAALSALQHENEGVKAAMKQDMANRVGALNKGPQAVSPIQGLIDQFQNPGSR